MARIRNNQTYLVTCPQCGCERYLKQAMYRRSKQKKTVCRSCASRKNLMNRIEALAKKLGSEKMRCIQRLIEADKNGE